MALTNCWLRCSGQYLQFQHGSSRPSSWNSSPSASGRIGVASPKHGSSSELPPKLAAPFFARPRGLEAGLAPAAALRGRPFAIFEDGKSFIPPPAPGLAFFRVMTSGGFSAPAGPPRCGAPTATGASCALASRSARPCYEQTPVSPADFA